MLDPLASTATVAGPGGTPERSIGSTAEPVVDTGAAALIVEGAAGSAGQTWALTCV